MGIPCARLFHQKVMDARSTHGGVGGGNLVDICGVDTGSHEKDEAGREIHRGLYQGARWTRDEQTRQNTLTGWDEPGERVRRGKPQ